MSPAKDRGLGDFGVPDRRRERSAATLRSATAASRDPDDDTGVAAAPSTPDQPSQGAPAGPAPMPPPRRRRHVRVQLNTRIAQDLHERLQGFVGEHDAAVQDVVEAALTEYLDRRA